MECIKNALIVFCCLFSFPLFGDNLHFSEVHVVAVSDTEAVLEITVSWNNSWRHAYNHDAVYLFGKYCVEEHSGWRHVFFSPLASSHTVSDGFIVTPTDDGRGLVLRRSSLGSGSCEASLRLTWSLSGNLLSPLTGASVLSGSVRFSLHGLELVYLPPGPFYAGDGISESSFSTSFFGGIPASSDIIGTDVSYVYSANGSESSSVYANRVADRYNQGIYNASSRRDWCGTTFPATWQVDFGVAKKILYFGVSGVYPDNIPPAPSGTWYFEGSVNGSSWTPLWSGGPEFWGQSRISYPVQQSIRVSAPGFYRYYRVRVDSSQQFGYWNTIRISNVAMTEEDLSLRPTDRVVLMDGFHPELPSSYPSGTEGFYAMKYELTQEQYVTFLNQLPRSAQYARTIGGVLDRLEEGDYVFGGLPASSSHRNGIVVHDRRLNSGLPILFACDLDRSTPANGSSDGQSVACNYLSPSDLLSYAEWSGLRPMSELEYEKMGRSFSPDLDSGGGPAWGSSLYVPGTGLSSAGTSFETVTPADANTNAGAHLSGPVRSGSFTRSGSRFESGLSFWGLSDLSGNLSEIYCNTNSWGIQLSRSSHGAGEITSDGNHLVSGLSWPLHPLAYGWRGGDYSSDFSFLSLSYRGQSSSGVYAELSQRYPVAGFRLGLSWSDPSGRSELLLSNGLSTGGAEVSDTICDGMAYELRGVDPPVSDPAVYFWYESVDGGNNWRNLNTNSAVLHLPDLVSRVSSERVSSFRYKRVIYTSSGLLASGVAVLVVGRGYSADRLSDTVRPCMVSAGFRITTPLPATFEWTFIGRDASLKAKSTAQSSEYVTRVSDLTTEEQQFPTGRYELGVTIKLLGRCTEHASLSVVVLPVTVNPFESEAVAYTYNNADTYRIPRKWGGADRQFWRLTGKSVGTLLIDDSTGVLSGIGSTFLKEVAVELVCRDYPDQVYRVVYSEKQRDFAYTGAAKAITLLPGSYLMECRGAQAGMYSTGQAGPNGALTQGVLSLADQKTFHLYVGQAGYSYPANHSYGAPFNGGGEGLNGGGDGGGATDIRVTGGTWNNAASLYSRIMVAAGGGGSDSRARGGEGGGITGVSARYSISAQPGYGGTQTATGLKTGIQFSGGFGYGGGSSSGYDGGGGGGGYYGGGGGNNGEDGGGGGSSFISGYPLCNAVDINGSHTGQPNHYSGYVFERTYMKAGGGSAGNGSIRISVEEGWASAVPDNTPKTIRNYGTYRAWSDGTYALSAEAYRRPSGAYRYEGDVGNGIYRIDPDGQVGVQAPIDVYCDMTTGDGGWTLVAAQYERDPVAWSQGIQANYDPTLNSKKSFALNNSQLPPHTYTAFGKDKDPTFVGYSQILYSVGDLGWWVLPNLKTGQTFHLHRNSALYYVSHDPESSTGNTAIWNNTLTYDLNGGIKHSWSFAPQNTTEVNRGYAMGGVYTGDKNMDYAWTVWVK
jgi:hypothetical protein